MTTLLPPDVGSPVSRPPVSPGHSLSDLCFPRPVLSRGVFSCRGLSEELGALPVLSLRPRPLPHTHAVSPQASTSPTELRRVTSLPATPHHAASWPCQSSQGPRPCAACPVVCCFALCTAVDFPQNANHSHAGSQVLPGKPWAGTGLESVCVSSALLVAPSTMGWQHEQILGQLCLSTARKDAACHQGGTLCGTRGGRLETQLALLGFGD